MTRHTIKELRNLCKTHHMNLRGKRRKLEILEQCYRNLINGPNRMQTLQKDNRVIHLLFDEHGLENTCDDPATPIGDFLLDILTVDNIDVYIEMTALSDSFLHRDHPDTFLKQAIQTLAHYVPAGFVDETMRTYQNVRYQLKGRVHVADVRDRINLQDLNQLHFPTQAVTSVSVMKILIPHFYAQFKNMNMYELLDVVKLSYAHDYPILNKELQRLNVTLRDDLIHFYDPIIRDEVYTYGDMLIRNMWSGRADFTLDKYDKVHTALLGITSSILDLYTLARILKPKQCSDIAIVYAGQWHCANMSRFLLAESWEDARDITAVGRCLNIGSMFISD